MELKLEHVLIFMVFIFLVQFVMRNCHCDFNRLIEGTENERDKTVINLTNLNLTRTSKPIVYFYNWVNSNWYLYNGNYEDFKEQRGKIGYENFNNVEYISQFTKVLDINYKSTLTKLKNNDVELISYSTYPHPCDSTLGGVFGHCTKGLFTINLNKIPGYQYTIQWKNFHSGDGIRKYCGGAAGPLQITGDIYKLTRFTRERKSKCT